MDHNDNPRKIGYLTTQAKVSKHDINTITRNKIPGFDFDMKAADIRKIEEMCA